MRFAALMDVTEYVYRSTAMVKAAMGAAAVRGVMVPKKRERGRGRVGLGVVWDCGLWVGGRLVIVLGDGWWVVLAWVGREVWCWCAVRVMIEMGWARGFR